MSMNVADSTDLIHGGLICRGGSLGNFWRSRTDFEQKLLVAMSVMTLVIIGMTIAVIVLAVENGKSNPATTSVKTDGQPTVIKSKEVTTAAPEEAMNEIGKKASPSRIPSTILRYEDTSQPKTPQSKDASLQEEAVLIPSNSNEETQDDYVIDKHSSPNQSYITERLLMSL